MVGLSSCVAHFVFLLPTREHMRPTLFVTWVVSGPVSRHNRGQILDKYRLNGTFLFMYIYKTLNDAFVRFYLTHLIDLWFAPHTGRWISKKENEVRKDENYRSVIIMSLVVLSFYLKKTTVATKKQTSKIFVQLKALAANVQTYWNDVYTNYNYNRILGRFATTTVFFFRGIYR